MYGYNTTERGKWFFNNEMKSIQMKTTEQYFPAVLFFMLYKVVLAFESVDEILKSDCSKIKSH